MAPPITKGTPLALDITDMVRPQETAVVINECQEGVIGRYSSLPAIAEATDWIIPNVDRLIRAAHHNGVAVMHTVAGRRPDGRGALVTGLMGRARTHQPSEVTPEEYAGVVPGIEQHDSDFVVTRLGGMGGMSASNAIPILRSLGVKTLVLGGITLNAGVISTMFNAIDEGFQAVVVSDASSGFPREYGDEVLRRTVRPFAPIVTVDEVLAAWSAHAAVGPTATAGSGPA
jgi:nicotinamidase-related amidase